MSTNDRIQEAMRNANAPPSRSLGYVTDFAMELPGTADAVVIDVTHEVIDESADTRIAKKFVDAVVSGQGAAEAAATAGVPLQVLQRDTRIRQYIREAKRKYEANADEIREAVVLKWLEMGFDDPDPKLRLVALRELSLMPEIGLKSPKVTASAGRKLSAETEAALNSLENE